MSSRGWYGVDLDGTLAHYDEWISIHHIGPPIVSMVARVKDWLAAGRDVRIFTARVGQQPVDVDMSAIVQTIENWCLEHIGQVLPITCTKDWQMLELWDDRCVQIISNTGQRADGMPL